MAASAPARSARPRARRGEGARLRAEILDAATGLLVETGDEAAVSVRAVAQRVGITPPSIYLHFADKDELIFECCRALMGRLRQQVDAAVADVADPGERLRVAARAYVRFGIDNPVPYRTMLMSPRPGIPADLDVADYEGAAGFAMLVDMVADILGDATAPDPAVAAMGLLAAAHGLTALMIAKAVEPIAFPWPDVDRVVDHLVDVHLAGLHALRTPPPDGAPR